jgi:hypothetical protein
LNEIVEFPHARNPVVASAIGISAQNQLQFIIILTAKKLKMISTLQLIKKFGCTNKKKPLAITQTDFTISLIDKTCDDVYPFLDEVLVINGWKRSSDYLLNTNKDYVFTRS